jgi:nitrilase
MRIGAAQVRGVWGRPGPGAERVAEWLARAGAEGVDLLAFGETHLGGYPFWISATNGSRFDDDGQKRAYAAYLDAAVELDSPEVRLVREAVGEHRVFTYLGIAERGSGLARGSVYATLLAIDPERGVLSAHRKLQPTYEERLAWAQGDGQGLRVHTVSGRGGDVMRVGGLSCWENWLPQARLAMYAGGEDIHVSVWPGAVRNTIDIARFIALEGRVYSLAAGTIVSRSDVPDSFPLAAELPDGDWADGGSAIAAPDGTWLREPVSGQEGLVIAEVDPARVREERQNFDPTGHYARPDVFELRVDRRRLAAATFSDGDDDSR